MPNLGESSKGNTGDEAFALQTIGSMPNRSRRHRQSYPMTSICDRGSNDGDTFPAGASVEPYLRLRPDVVGVQTKITHSDGESTDTAEGDAGESLRRLGSQEMIIRKEVHVYQEDF